MASIPKDENQNPSTAHQSLQLRADAIARLLKHEVKPVFFLGAGASVKSGIPTAEMLVEAIVRFSFCKVHDKSPDDPTLMRSDWIRWRDQQSWYRQDQPVANLYPFAIENLLQPRSNRREFFQRILKPGLPPSQGYTAFAALLARRLVRTVLTTNFDDLVVKTAEQTPKISHIEKIATQSDHTLFRTDPPNPQIIYLHGSVFHYTDRNLITETQELDRALLTMLQPLLRDHPLVVVGYRGTEPSIMKHLLLDQAAKCRNFCEGIYWCHLPNTNPIRESPLIAELAALIGSNLQFVEIEGFDELMTTLERLVDASAVDAWGMAPASPESTEVISVNDLQPSDLILNDLNVALLRTKLVDYASAMRLPAPTLGTDEQLWTAMLARKLAITVKNSRFPTKGGQLLFAKSTDKQADSAKINVTVAGPSSWVDEILDQSTRKGPSPDIVEETVLTGDLWSQLDQASILLSRVNIPFRIKGHISKDTYPYPPMALKELLTNLLAHRSYEDNRSAKLTITPDEIRFENPGGLVDSVRRQLEDESIQQFIGTGVRRLKGYRNPVIADFFFSAGAMDKEGSGLPDVLRDAESNLNLVTFGPANDNTVFIASIKCRPEALLVNSETKTAPTQQREIRYSPNLLRVLAWPEQVHKLGTIATHQELSGIENAHPAPFGSYRNWLWTFAKTDDAGTHPLLNLCIDEERHTVATDHLLNDKDAVNILPRLLNSALLGYLPKLGLSVRCESGRIRAYYPLDNGGPREIPYRSMFRQSKRTVTKPIVSRMTGKITYWEHKAVSLRFEKFGSSWALSLLPGYIFTIDGDSRSIASERIGPLSTRRAARDYNPTVMHDLVFWSRMLSGGSETEFRIPLSIDDPSIAIVVSPMIPAFILQEPSESGVSEANEIQNLEEDEELKNIQDEIEQAISEGDDETGQDITNETSDI